MTVIVDYGLGNLGSVANMLRKASNEPVLVSEHTRDIESASRLILPGVGHFDRGSRNLRSNGFAEVLTRRVLLEKVPILGICLGMQLMSEGSEEGNEPGLGWIKGRFQRFRFTGSYSEMKIPHMGWNFLDFKHESPLFTDLPANARFYFVHSYHFCAKDPGDVIATTTYGYDFGSVFGVGNILGVQFHPEKSHRFGMKLLQNFVRYF
jgi:imidazole glycerol-phosphate synthase subunit HisH